MIYLNLSQSRTSRYWKNYEVSSDTEFKINVPLKHNYPNVHSESSWLFEVWYIDKIIRTYQPLTSKIPQENSDHQNKIRNELWMQEEQLQRWIHDSTNKIKCNARTRIRIKEQRDFTREKKSTTTSATTLLTQQFNNQAETKWEEQKMNQKKAVRQTNTQVNSNDNDE